MDSAHFWEVRAFRSPNELPHAGECLRPDCWFSAWNGVIVHLDQRTKLTTPTVVA